MSVIPKKKDPSVTFLNKYGFNVVKAPRAGIEPMCVIGRDVTTNNLGQLRHIWTSDKSEPIIGPPLPSFAFNGTETDALDLSFGLKVLSGALAAFGASVPSLDVAYQSAHSVHFAYTNVTSVSVEPLAVGQYLAHGTLETDNPVVRNYFFDPKSSAYLIIEVLKSDSITITATDSHGVTVGVDLPAIQGLVGTSVKVKPSSSENSTITFTGPTPITFAFNVLQIVRDGDRWMTKGALPSGNIAFGAGVGSTQQQTDASAPIVFDTGSFDCRFDI